MRSSPRSATIKGVAEYAGVSIATVSRALTNPSLLHADTLAKVDAAIEQLGYRPNQIARDLRRSETRLVMVIVPRLSPYFLEIFRGVETAADKVGYGVLVGHTDRDRKRETEFISQVRSRRADGLILAASTDPDAIVASNSQAPPIVLAIDGGASKGLPSVVIDHVAAAQAATEHLLDLGHRHVGLIMGAAGSGIAADRRLGYERALGAKGRTVDPVLCVQGDFSVESGEQAMEMLLKGPTRPTAVFAANDEMAIGAMRTLKRHGLRIPDDMSVSSVDGQRIAALSDPPLTTVSVPAYDIGYRAMMTLYDIMQGQPITQRKVLKTELIVRGSTAKPKR
jgi:LacI family transcriptional regulator, repressor for deo operon, udp, cdd, tsx, nupC, and nupG